MAEAYIVSAVRTAGGRRNGRLSTWHPVDLGAAALDAAVARAGLPGAVVDDVIIGCVSQSGEQSMHVGRNCVLASSLPQSVPAVTIDRQCGSSQQAIQFAAQAVMSGTQDIVIAGGVESMSRVPMGSPMRSPEGSDPLSRTVKDKFKVDAFSQFLGAEMIARKWGFERGELDAFALESHLRAQRATNAGAFKDEILPLQVVVGGEDQVHDIDEGIRWDATLESIGSVKLLAEGGVISAANASQITDGAAAVVLASERAVKEHGLAPLARIVNMTVTAGDPVIMLEEPLFATEKALKRAGMVLSDIDLFEVNEAFASVPLAWLKHLGGDRSKLNVNGGAIALGHPLGATGAKLMATMIYALKARGAKFGLQTMCEGGGIANVTIIEVL